MVVFSSKAGRGISKTKAFFEVLLPDYIVNATFAIYQVEINRLVNDA